MSTFAYTAISQGRPADQRDAGGGQARRGDRAGGAAGPAPGQGGRAARRRRRGGRAAKAEQAARPGRVSQKAVEAFTRELANLLAGGVPLARSLSLLRREAANAAAKHLWSSIHDDVVGGTALADAMAKYPQELLQRLRRDGPRRRGRRVPRRRARADRRLPHPRGRPQGQGQGGDGLPRPARRASRPRCDLPADVLHPEVLRHLRRSSAASCRRSPASSSR